MEHELKTWTPYFQDVLDGKKTFEYRVNDRNFKLGDWLTLKEWDQDKQEYTGRSFQYRVTYIIYGGMFGIPKDYCIMQVK